MQGLDNTKKANYGGGNTDWEESRLGQYANRLNRMSLDVFFSIFIITLLQCVFWREQQNVCHCIQVGSITVLYWYYSMFCHIVMEEKQIIYLKTEESTSSVKSTNDSNIGF